jgi:hypothetical protein
MFEYSFAEVVQVSLLNLWGRLLQILPDLIGAFIIIIVGFIVAPILGGITKKFFDVLKIDILSEKVGIKEVVSSFSPNFSISLLIGKLVKWFFILAFVMAAADVLGWNRITVFLNEIIFYIPNVLISIIILVFGNIAGNLFGDMVTKTLRGSNTPIGKPEVMGMITKWSIVIFAVLASLLHIGIAPSLIQILFAGIVLALSLSFGLGGKKKVEEILDEIYKKKKTTSRK